MSFLSDLALPYVLPLLVSGGLSAALALAAWRRRPAPGAATFAVLAVALCQWCLTYALALSATTPTWQTALSKLRYLGITAIPVLWLVLALQYTGRRHLLTAPRLALLLVVPVVTQIFTWHPTSHLMIVQPTPTAPPPFANVAFDYGPWFWIHLAFAYSAMVVGIMLLISHLSRQGPDYRRQLVLLLAAALAPFVANIITAFQVFRNPDLDLTPFVFLFSSSALMLAIFRFRLLRLVPVAHDAVFEQMQDGVIVLDGQGLVLELNPAAVRMLGLSAAAAGQPVLSLLPQWASVWERLGDLAPGGEEVTLGEGEGQQWFDLAVTPLAEPQTGQQGWLLVLRNVTGRKRSRQALAANELRYRTLFETSTDAIFLETVEGRILDCNVAACQQYGYSREEMRQLRVADLVPPEVARQLEAAVASELAIGGLHLESRARRRNGEVFPVEVTTRLVRIGDEDLVVAYVRDLTDRVRAEERWRWSETLLRAVAENSPLALYVVDDRHDRVLFLNSRFRDLWGLPEEGAAAQLSGVEIGTLLAEQVAGPEGFRRLWYQLRGEIPRTVVEQDLPLLDGRVLRWLSTQVRDADGRYVGRLHIFADITDRKRAEDSQRLAAVGQLAAGVAHEFNNLLCSMRLRADLAELKGEAATYQELARLVIEGAERGAQVCDDLLSFSRPRALSRAPQNIEGPIETALSLAEPQLAAARVTVCREYAATPHLVYIDAGQIEQVCLNIILNACHAMAAAGGRLTVTTTYEPVAGGQVVVRFTDTGTGIRPEDLPHVFEPFFTTKGRLGESDIPGTGLGLSVSHGLLQAHGATITVHSEWGHGATFELRFREWRESVTQTLREAVRLEEVVTAVGPARVLLAEDEITVRNTIAETLRLRGCQVMSVASVPEALGALRTGHFELVITDLLMPGGHGLEVVRAAARGPRPPLVLVMTGQVSSTLERDLRQAGATRWILKPFGMPELMALVDEMLPRVSPSR